MRVWIVSAFCFPHHEPEHLQYVQEDAMYLGPMVSKTSLLPKTYRSEEDKQTALVELWGPRGGASHPAGVLG